MRFLKKASSKQLPGLVKYYKQFELFLSRDDLKQLSTDFIPVLQRNESVIEAIHCPSSIYLTDCDQVSSTNFLSFCELLQNESEFLLFKKICQFANECAEVQGNQLIVILHTGCVLGCNGNVQGFTCPFQCTDAASCPFQSPNAVNLLADKASKIVELMKKYKNIDIAFENITPYRNQNGINRNSGYGFENTILAEACSKLDAENTKGRFGTVLDFCHALITSETQGAAFNLKSFSEQNQKWVKLIHLAGYDSAYNHGKTSFKGSGQLQEIKSLCVSFFNTVPITLEVEDGESIEKGSAKFIELMLNWNYLHSEFKDYVSEDTYKQFFCALYEIFAKDLLSADASVLGERIRELRSYICRRSHLPKKLFAFSKEQQRYNLNALQLQAYVYYMRYCQLVLDLKKSLDPEVSKETVDYYIFNDQYHELRFEGLAYYYNIYWRKGNQNLYRCDDGCYGEKELKGNFLTILQNCKSQIEGNSNLYSTSKYFGRCLLKYFHGGSRNHIYIYKNAPLNFVKVDDEVLTLQQFQLRCLDKDSFTIQDFSLDFSCFLNGRDKEEASLSALFIEALGNSSYSGSTGSIYDGEVIFLRQWEEGAVQKYELSDGEFKELMTAYFIRLKTDTPNAGTEVSPKITEILDALDWANEKLHWPDSRNSYSATTEIRQIKEELFQTLKSE